MQLKSKLLFGLVATVLMVGMMVPTAAAQMTVTVSSDGAGTEVASSRNAMTGSRDSAGNGIKIIGLMGANTILTTTSLTISYGANITSDGSITTGGANVPAGDAIRLLSATGVFVSASIRTINFTTGVITLGLPGFDAIAASADGQVTLAGVRIDASTETAPVTATAAIGSTANGYTLANTAAVTVITALTAGIGSAAIGKSGTATSLGTGTLFTNGTLGDSDGAGSGSGASILITEGFASAWRTATQESNSGTALAGNGTQIELTFTGIQTGMSLALSVPTLSSLNPTIDDATLTVTAADNDAVFTLPATSLTTIDTFQVDVSITTTGSPTSFTAGSITVTADLNPLGTALTTANIPTETGGYPRFATALTAALTTHSVIAARTTLLVPYIVSDGTYDTGIAIANTTADPYSGSGGATAGAGTIAYTFYPRTATGAATAITLTTSATKTPGTGLSATGTLVSGGTHSVMLSDLLVSAGQTAAQSLAFTGYVFIETNFILAHGISYISDFAVGGATFTSFTPMMVVPETNTTTRVANESLSF